MPTGPLADPPADSSDDEVDEVHPSAVAEPSDGEGQACDQDDNEEYKEYPKKEDTEDTEDSGGEDTVDATQQWKDEEAEGTPTEVRKCIAR